jgi:AcrR family transcriptional regulator
MIEVVQLFHQGGEVSDAATVETVDTPERILEAADQCLRRLGVRRVSMGDVAAQAKLSRGSVYRYFPDRQALLDAVLERAADRFVSDSTLTIDRRPTLAAQVGEAAVFILVHRHDDAFLAEEDTLFATVLSARVHGLLERWVEFWLPRLAEAEQRGEIRCGLDHRQTAEWIVRLMLSFAVMPSVTVDLDDSDAVRRFVDAHLVRGLAP